MKQSEKEYTCSNCGAVTDMSSCLADESVTAKPGDISVCLYCGHVTAYDENLDLRELTKEEQIDIAGSPQLLETMEFCQFFKDYKKRTEEGVSDDSE